MDDKTMWQKVYLAAINNGFTTWEALEAADTAVSQTPR